MSRRVRIPFIVVLLGLTIILSGCLGGMVKRSTSPSMDPYSVSGKIIDGDENSIEGVTLLLSGDSNETTTSDSDGTWKFINIKGKNAIIPSLANHSFQPSQISVTKTDDGKTFTFEAMGSGNNNGTCDLIGSGSGTQGDPYVIRDVAGLQAMSEDLEAHYVLCADIDAFATSAWKDDVGHGAGFAPIGNESNPFTGTFDGRGFTIDGLYIDRPSERDVGLFGYVSNKALQNDAEISNVGLTNAVISGDVNVGALVGIITGGNSANPDNFSKVTNSYSTGTVDGNVSVGGLVGTNADRARITNSYSEASVSGNGGVGGLAGTNRYSATIENSYSTGNVEGLSDSTDYGGLVGFNWSFSNINSSYSTGNVTSTGSRVGGLVGYNHHASTIENSYAMGDVHGGGGVGGLVGAYAEGYIVKNSYSTGKVTGNETGIGGLIGERVGNQTVERSYWDTETSEIGSSAGGSGRLTNEMKAGSTNYNNWDTDIWYFQLGEYPDLIDNPRQP